MLSKLFNMARAKKEVAEEVVETPVVEATCSTCNGDGLINPRTLCADCNGTGKK